MAAGVLLTQPPAMHVQPYWPFPLRFSGQAMAEPELGAIVLWQIAEAAIALILVASAIGLHQRP